MSANWNQAAGLQAVAGSLQKSHLLQAVEWSNARLGILGILGILLLAYDLQSAPHQIKTSILSIRSILSNHSQRRTLKPARRRWYLNCCRL
jgi:hypothetical protein